MTTTFTRFDRFTAAHAYAIAGSADALVALAGRGDIPGSWRYWGAPEADYFVAAAPDVNPRALKRLAIDGRLLIPSDADWLPMSLADVAEFCASLDAPLDERGFGFPDGQEQKPSSSASGPILRDVKDDGAGFGFLGWPFPPPKKT